MHILKYVFLVVSLFSNLLYKQNFRENESSNFINKIICENFDYSTMENKSNHENNNENFQLLVKFNYETIISNELNNDKERKEEFERLKEYYYTKNCEIVKNIELNLFDDYYISKYSPFISITSQNNELFNDNLMNIANDDNVENIYVNIKHNNEENVISALNYIDFKNYLNNEQYDAEGVTVGILEPGIVDKNHKNLANSNLVVRDEWYYKETVTEHATMIASVISGENGIAKKCKLLSVELSGDAISEIDWLIDNGVNVINCSYGDKNPTGKYSSKSAYMDYISSTYKITFIASSGNTGDTNSYVSNPGLGYNVITIGACNSTSGVNTKFSSFNVIDGPRKPNIVAPGDNLRISNFNNRYSGTSLSAAIVTGCVAALMKKDTLLKYHPERVASRLYAYSNNPNSSFFGNGFDNYVGAGVINFNNIIELKSERNYYINKNDNSRTFSVNLNANDEFRLVLSCLANANGNASGTRYSDYNIYLYDSNNNLVNYEATNVDTLELLEMKITKTDTYTIKIIRNNEMPYDYEYISVNYCIK